MKRPCRRIAPPPDAPAWVLQVVGGSLQFSDAALRLYAHPDLLRVAAAFDGEDFSPFNEVWFDAAGSDRLPDAVPLLCAPGDVAITNRQAVHGSFTNTSAACRVTINFGFHPRASVIGARGNGIHAAASDQIIYHAAHVRQRSQVLGLAIAARRQRFPDETRWQHGVDARPHGGVTTGFAAPDGRPRRAGKSPR